MPALSSSRLGAILSGAKSIYVSACAAEIEAVPALLAQHRPRGATITGIFSPLVNHLSYADADLDLRVRAFLLTRALRADLARGLVDYCPWRYSMIERWMREAGRFDTGLIMVSPPDASGRCSLGLQADFLPSFYDKVENLVAFVNPQTPFTAGHTTIDYSSFAAVIDYDAPLPTMTLRETDPAAGAIAGTISNLVPDGATIQLGVGQIPSETLARLKDHRDLRVHTGIVDDNILILEASGALDRDHPIVTGTAIGDRPLYEACADRRRFALKPVSFTHAYQNIAGAPRFTAINSVLQADLLGQVSGEAIGGRIAATPGGLPDFVRGAQDSPGGQSIVAVRAGGAGKNFGVVPLIDNPAIVTCGGSDAHIIVTEFGAANLRGLTFDERAEAMMAIAAPQTRQSLADAWADIRVRLFGRGPAPERKFA